ncbi:RidA family protein [Bacillus tropicus]|nr:RidA family protein [Bacillus tropicus]MDF9589908.1 RidA family protein [Bacillus tropicus]MDF9649441.1 RidA family protein [Bacillus tropicus]
MQIERKKNSKCKLSKSEIIHLYAEGKSTSEIATLANVSARYIRMVLTDTNVPRRAIGSWKRKYDITENYFKTWSNNMAYFGQINHIEENYLKKKRPLRNKKRYYYAIQEQELADIEAFGMYGNTYLDLGEVQIGLYGNSRYSTLNLITANNEIFEEYFQNTNTDINYKKKLLVKGFVAADRQKDLHLNVVYEKLGLYQNSQPVIPVLKRTDLSTLNEIANTISEDLVLLFNENDKPLKQYFASSRYSKEITYEEFFIWWYHFFYTKVTEELIKQGVIITSTKKNQTYIIHQ